MPYKVGDLVKCQVEEIKGFKRVVGQVRDEPLEVQKFQIINRYLPYHGCEYYFYSILIPDDFVGWYISKFHTEHQNVSTAFLGKKFFDISDVSVIEE